MRGACALSSGPCAELTHNVNLRCFQLFSCSLSVLFPSDFVTVTLSLRYGDVTVTARDFTFYDCMAVKQLSGSMP